MTFKGILWYLSPSDYNGGGGRGVMLLGVALTWLGVYLT